MPSLPAPVNARSQRSTILISLAVFSAGALLWTLRTAHSQPAFAAKPLSIGAKSSPSPPLLSSNVAVHPARPRRAPMLLTRRNTSDPRATPALPTQPDERKALCARALLQLRDDDIRGNALKALQLLEALDSAADPQLRPLLIACLSSRDLQQRSLVASFLRARTESPEDEMLIAAAQDLGDDVVPKATKSLSFQGYPEDWQYSDGLRLPHRLRNATEAARLLISAGERAWPQLQGRLHSHDPQARFLAAVVLARTRCEQNQRLTVTILVTHLKHNDWKGDAIIAGHALHALGHQALPHLERLRGVTGNQAQRLVHLAIEEIKAPSPNAQQANARARRLAPAPSGHPLAVWRFIPDPLDGLVWR